MTPEEELALISTLLDEHFVPKTRGLGIYSVYGRVALLAEKAAQQSVRPTLLESPREQTRCDCEACQKELSELPQSG